MTEATITNLDLFKAVVKASTKRKTVKEKRLLFTNDGSDLVVAYDTTEAHIRAKVGMVEGDFDAFEIQPELLEKVVGVFDEMHLIVETSHVRFEGKGKKAKIAIASDFQVGEPPEKAEDSEFTAINAKDFFDYITSVFKASAKDEYMINLHGIYFDPERKNIVGTDGFRMHVFNIDFLGEVPALIHYDYVKNALEVLSGYSKKDLEDMEIRFGVVGKHFYIATEDVEMYGRLVDADFPDYERVIPKDEEPEAKIRIGFDHTDEFKKLAEMLRIKTDKMLFSVGNNLKITVGDELFSLDSAFEFDVEGKLLGVYFNPKYVLDALNTAKQMMDKGLTEMIEVRLYGNMRPMTVEAGPFLAVMMPIRAV